MTKCDFCGRNIEKIRRTKRIFVKADLLSSRLIEGGGYDLPFICKYCNGIFCSDHRLPENHDCPNLPKTWSERRHIPTNLPTETHISAKLPFKLAERENFEQEIKTLSKKVEDVHDHDGVKVIHDDDGQLWIHGRRHSRINDIDPVISKGAKEKLSYMKDFEYIGEVKDQAKLAQHNKHYAANVPKPTVVWKIILLMGLGLVGLFYMLYPSRFHEVFNNLVQMSQLMFYALTQTIL